MAEGDGAVEEREMETQEINSDEEALLHFGKYSEARAAMPWEQRTFKEKVLHHVDRIFLIFLALFLLVLLGDFLYKMWYVTSWRKIWEFILETVSYLFIQEKDEELIEL
ncbi:hypothetical protein QQF64_028286 [Cirrhinus molitorella]|uniref:Uncharacterized protein n=1 Tax=Cirrhinus molitorella TaxID=172907 RepID=A0ABR3N6C0_9TELE